MRGNGRFRIDRNTDRHTSLLLQSGSSGGVTLLMRIEGSEWRTSLRHAWQHEAQQEKQMIDKIERRDFIRSIAVSGALGVLGPASSGLPMNALAQPAEPARAGIDPMTIKRRGVGLRGYDPDRAFRGFTHCPRPTRLFTSSICREMSCIPGICRIRLDNRHISRTAGRSSTTVRFRTRAMSARRLTRAAPHWKWIGTAVFCGR